MKDKGLADGEDALILRSETPVLCAVGLWGLQLPALLACDLDHVCRSTVAVKVISQARCMVEHLTRLRGVGEWGKLGRGGVKLADYFAVMRRPVDFAQETIRDGADGALESL